MKKLLVHPVAIMLTVLITVYFLVVFLSWNSTTLSGISIVSSSQIKQLPEGDTSFGGLFFRPYINDSLPYYQYKQTEDSLLNANQLRLEKNNLYPTGFSVGIFGLLQVNKHEQIKESPNLYFLSIASFDLKTDVKFYIDNNDYKLAYIDWDTLSKKGEPLNRIGEYKSVKIPAGYIENDKKILIPISKTQYFAGTVILSIIAFSLLILMIFVAVGYPVQFLIRISKGQAFTEINVAGLRITSLLLIAYLLGSLLLPVLVRLFFAKYIHHLFKPLDFVSLVSDKLGLLFISIIVFAVYLAFKKGYKLQQEQELTV